MPRFTRTSLLVLLTLTLLPMLAQAQGLTIYALDRDSNQLRAIDPVTGATVSSVSVTLTGFTVTGGVGLAVDPTDGTMYALLRVDPLVAGSPTVRELVSLTTSGVATAIGAADDGNAISMADITFDDTGQLWGVTGDGSVNPSTLYTIDKTSGAATLVVALGNGADGEAIGFNPGDGLIYHASGRDSTPPAYETIDPANPLNAPVAIGVSGPVIPDEATALGAWGNNFFIWGNIDNELWIIDTGGNARKLADLQDAFAPQGLVVVGTAPDCTATGQMCGAAYNGPDGPAVLYSISQADGSAQMIGPVGSERLNAMAFEPSTSVLFGVAERMDGSNTQVLIEIDPSTGAGSEHGPTGLAANVSDISFRHSDGTLFGFDFNGNLITFNTTTGTATTVGAITNRAGCCGNALAFDASDTLFFADDSSLLTVDPATGAGTVAFAMNYANPPWATFGRTNAMDFDATTGTLFAAAPEGFPPTGFFLATVDPASGAVTSVGPTQAQLDAIAIVPADADLAVTKVDDSGGVAVAVNDVVTYTITVTNGGPGIASVVQATDVLSGAAVTSAAATTSTVGTCDDSAFPTITCDLGAMAPAAVATITIQVNATTAGAIVNDVDVTTGTVDPNTANNTAQVVTGVGSADVSVTKVDAVDPVTHPAGIVYTITVTNNALTAAEVAGGVVVTDTFTGAAVTFGSAVPSQGTCNAALPVVCNLGDIAGMGGFATVAVTVNTAAVGTVTDTATVTTATTDPTPANNTAVQTTLVNGIDLVVTKTDSGPTAINFNITYVVTVSNTGNIPATLVALTDNFTGAAATFVSATPSQGTCTPAFPAVPCDLGTIAAGANATVTIVVTPTAAGTVTNTASATATESATDPNSANNTNIVRNTTVAATQDFSVAGSPASRTILPGQSATFTVTVTPLPFVATVDLSCSVTIPLGSCSITPSTVNPGNLPATATLTVNTTGFFVAQHRAPNQSAPVYAYWLPATAGFGALGLMLVGANRKRLSRNRRAQFLAILSLLLAITLLVGCPLGRDREDEGTPGGTYTVTITGVGAGLTRTATVDVVVQGTN